MAAGPRSRKRPNRLDTFAGESVGFGLMRAKPVIDDVHKLRGTIPSDLAKMRIADHKTVRVRKSLDEGAACIRGPYFGKTLENRRHDVGKSDDEFLTHVRQERSTSSLAQPGPSAASTTEARGRTILP